jgi:molybdenum cofactor cytidylyltransferase
MISGLYTIILAAGSAERFGSPKQLATLGGSTLVARSLGLATEVTAGRVILVTGANWQEVIDDCVPLDGFIVRNEHFSDGIGGSLAAGVRTVESVADAVLILLCDQALITAAHLEELIHTWRNSPDTIVASRYGDVCGVPAIFPARYFRELIDLDGDQGARKVIRKYGSTVIEVVFEDAAIDVDTPADLAKITT